MSIKDLFDRNFLSTTTQKDAYKDIESVDNLKAIKIKQESFLPQVDYSDPQSFAKFGSANLYYKSAIDRIINFYPYDGSGAEITNFYNQSLDIEKYLFNNKYPRTTGYAIMSPSSTAITATRAGGYSVPSVLEYITFNGGPNVVDETSKISKLVPDPTNNKFQYNNLYDENLYTNNGYPADYGSGTRLSNLRSNFDTGVTIEFWAKTGSIDSGDIERQVIFDMWNNNPSSSAGESYGRLRIEVASGSTYGTNQSPFLITVQSGTLSASVEQINTASIGASSLSHSLSEWKHYAFILENSGSDFKTSLYVNGELNDINVYESLNIGELSSKNMQGRIGGLLTAPTKLAVGGVLPSAYNGAGKLSGSLDEFRFWKVSRNAEEIGRYWFDQVRGGTNLDISNTTLGMYYKFNEGITQQASIDSVVLDFGGRLCNGTWTGYSSESRNTGSAIVSASAAFAEYRDPIIYGAHPDVQALRAELKTIGQHHDGRNNGQFLNLIPSWVVEEVEDDGTSDLEQVAHIMGAYFDKLYLQIAALPSFRHTQYTSASHEPFPFAQHLPQSLGLTTPEIFVDSKVLEKFANRTDTELFEKDLNETKNLIYQNLYNNLTTIFKSKGTFGAVRNILRCFNIDDNLVYFNAYANNQTYELNNNLKQTQKKKKRLNFNTASAQTAVMYQAADPAYPDSQGYIYGTTGSTNEGAEDKFGFTLEASVLFPRFFRGQGTTNRDFLTSSLFGMQTAFTGSTGAGYAGGTTSLTGAQDVANFQVYAIRDELRSKNVRFMLTSSYDPHPFDALTSSNYLSTYGNQNWNLSVALRPSNYPYSDLLSGSSDYTYDVIFRGFNNNLGTISNSFELSASISKAAGQSMLRSWKRVYLGAQNTNITGSDNIHKTDVLFNGMKYWTQYVDNTSLKQHAVDRENYGISGSYRNISALTSSAHDIYNFTSLALNWHFGTITGSDSGGNFYATDLSSGSADIRQTYGWVGSIAGYVHPGKAHGFKVDSADVVSNDIVNEFKFIDPEVVVGSDMINILTEDDELFGLFDEVPNYTYVVEKSLYAAVSEEILDYFAGVIDFNNMIGDPVHRYRMDYKPLELLRKIFFDKFGDLKAVEKYTEYFRWFDDAIAHIIQQVVPASADFIPDMYNTVESHVLERNKYQSQFPTMEFRDFLPEAPLHGIDVKLLNYIDDMFGGVEASPRPTNVHKGYWQKRAQPGAQGIGSYEISSGDNVIDANRRQFRDIMWSKPMLSSSQTVLSTDGGVQYTRNRLLGTQLLGVAKFHLPVVVRQIKGGVNFEPGKNIHYTYNSLYPAGPVNTNNGIFVPENVLYGETTNIEELEQETSQVTSSAIDELNKQKIYFGVVQGRDYDQGLSYTNTKNTFAFPFNVLSSSISGGVDSLIQSRTTASLTITNLHNDAYGSELEIPMQGPFTNYAVGGHQSRHIKLNVSASGKISDHADAYKGLDDYTSRPEAWKILLGKLNNPRTSMDDCEQTSGAIGMVGPDYPWPEANAVGATPYPMTASQKAVYYRDFIAKRPVNIRNIRMRTGSTILGNYQHNYDVVMTNGAYINPRNFIENQPALPMGTFSGSATSSTQVNTFLGIHRTNNLHHDFLPDYNISYLTSAASNSTVVLNRFAAPGGYDQWAPAYRDFRSTEYTPYATINLRNLTNIKNSQPPSGTFSEPHGEGTTGIRVFDIHGRDVGLTSHYARHTARFGRDSVALPAIPYSLTSSMYIRSPSVYAYSATSGLQGWWRLDGDVEDTGIAINSATTGPARDGTSALGNRPNLTDHTPSRFIQSASLNFDNTGDAINIGTQAVWDNIIGNDTDGTSKMTFSAWIRPEGVNSHANLSRILDFATGDVAFYIRDAGGNRWELAFLTKWNGANNVSWISNVNFEFNEWYHVAASYDATSSDNDAILYINGEAVAITEAGTAPAGTWDGIDGDDCYIGNNHNANGDWDGQLADVAIWNTIVPAADIQAIYQVGTLLVPGMITETTVPAPGATYDQLPGFHKIHRNNSCIIKQSSYNVAWERVNYNTGAVNAHTMLWSNSSYGNNYYKLWHSGSADGPPSHNGWAKDGAPENSQKVAVSMWFRLPVDNTQQRALITLGDDGQSVTSKAAFMVSIGGASECIIIDQYNPSGISRWTGQYAVQPNNWYHLVVSYDGTDPASGPSIYIDGAADTVSVLGGNYTGDQMLSFNSLGSGRSTIGAGPAGTTGHIPFKNLAIKEVAIYNDTLTSAEVTQIYNNATLLNLTSSIVAPKVGNLVTWLRPGDTYGDGHLLAANLSDLSASNTALSQSYAGTLGGASLSGEAHTVYDVMGNNHYIVYGSIDNNNRPPNQSGSMYSITLASGHPAAFTGSYGPVYGEPNHVETITYVSASQYDNFNVQHQIPRSTLQYAWITGAMESSSLYYNCGFTPPHWQVENKSASVYEAPIAFASQSAMGSCMVGPRRHFGISQPITSPEDSTIFVDFAGLNTVIYEPISASSNTMGYPQDIGVGEVFPGGGAYLNYASNSLAGPDTAKIGISSLSSRYGVGATGLNSIILNRHGPYGWPSWKPLRQQDHPILRNERRINKLSTQYLGNVQRNFDLPPVSMKGRPVHLNMSFATAYSTSLGGFSARSDNATLKTSYNNEMIGFNEWQLDNFTELNYDSEVTPFEQLVAMQNQANVQLNWILYTENIIPTTRREFLSESTRRVGYDNKFWRTNQFNRVTGGFGVANSCGVREYMDWDGVTRYLTQSIFCLDAPIDFMTRTGPPIITNFGGAPGPLSTLYYNASSMLTSNSAGELQNTYAFYHFTTGTHAGTPDGVTGYYVEDFALGLCVKNGALYSRKHMLNSPCSVNSPNGYRMVDPNLANSTPSPYVLNRMRQVVGLDGDPNEIAGPYAGLLVPTGSGEAIWEAGKQAGYVTMSVSYDTSSQKERIVTPKWVPAPSEPWYNDYSDFRQDIKTLAKGYAVIPEYRVSEQVEDHVTYGSLGGENFDTFSIPGTEFSSSQTNFYKDYSNSDFLKNFLDIRKMSNLKAKEIRLTCHAAIKFNPYKGFYPAQRSLQLVNQFSKSFAESMVVSYPKYTGKANNAPNETVSGSLAFGYGYVRPLMQSLFAPGILYNSIKSGIGVDYPIISDGNKVQAINLAGVSAHPDRLSSNYMIGNYSPLSASRKSNFGDQGYPMYQSYISGVFWDQRVPFEAIMDPVAYLDALSFADIEPHPSVKMPNPVTSSLQGKSPGHVYKAMASNFFAEVGKFFLKDKGYTKLRANGISDAAIKFRGDEIYGARLKMRTSYDGARTYDYESGSDGTNQYYSSDGAIAFLKEGTKSSVAKKDSGSFGLPQDPARHPFYKQNFVMYSRTTAFGPPVTGRQVSSSGGYLTASATTPLDMTNTYYRPYARAGSAYGVKDSLNGYNWAFTPPYYHGEAWCDFIFTPSGGVSYDLEKILQETTIIQRRYDPGPPMYGHKFRPGFYRRTLVSDVDPQLVPTGSLQNMKNTSNQFPAFPQNFQPYASENINDNAMQLNSCINFLGIEQIPKITYDKYGRPIESTNETIGSRWVIQPKFETPMMNFADSGVRPITASTAQSNATEHYPSGSSTVTLPTNFGSSSVPRGMWHQFGVLPESPDKGIFLEINDIPKNWLKFHYDVASGSTPYNRFTTDGTQFKIYEEMKSFSKLMGFAENNSSVRLGDVAEYQTIKEAVVAVPYVVEGLVEGEKQPSGRNAQTRKKFINIPKKRFEAALAQNTKRGKSLDTAGISIRKMVEAMDTYVFPPQFNFKKNPQLDPIVMYLFEFEYKLDKNDLAYIWQNTAPRNYKELRLTKEATAHTLADTELLTEENLLANPNLRWMVFKVKQKSQTLYPEMVTAQAGEPKRKLAHVELLQAQELSFNWPYDFVSIVESVKIDAEVRYGRTANSIGTAPARNKSSKESATTSKKARRDQDVYLPKKLPSK